MQLFKYPSTPVLPWSPASKENDYFDTTNFEGKEVIITEKMDGESCTMYQTYIHARSLDSGHHVSRDYVKALHAMLQADIPTNWRLCGENVYAQHSIFYDNLKEFFYLFSVWDETNTALSWESTKEWATLLNLPTPKEFYHGVWDESLIKNLKIDVVNCEGYVVRTTNGFPYNKFHKHIAKWVRPNHVQTNKHWRHQTIIPNKLKICP